MRKYLGAEHMHVRNNKALAAVLGLLSLWPVSIPVLLGGLVALFFLIVPHQALIYDEETSSKVGYAFAQNFLNDSPCHDKTLSLVYNEASIVNESSENPIRFHNQIFDVLDNNQKVGEIQVFVYDNIKFLGLFPIHHNELINQDMRCENE